MKSEDDNTQEVVSYRPSMIIFRSVPLRQCRHRHFLQGESYRCVGSSFGRDAITICLNQSSLMVLQMRSATGRETT